MYSGSVICMLLLLSLRVDALNPGEPMPLDSEHISPALERVVQKALDSAVQLHVVSSINRDADSLQLLGVASGTEQVVSGVRYRMIVEAEVVPRGCRLRPCTLRDKLDSATFVCAYNGRGNGTPNGFLHYIKGDNIVAPPRPPLGSGAHHYAFYNSSIPNGIKACEAPSSKGATPCPACAAMQGNAATLPYDMILCVWSAVGPLERAPGANCGAPNGSAGDAASAPRRFFALDFVDRPWETNKPIEMLSFGEVTFEEIIEVSPEEPVAEPAASGKPDDEAPSAAEAPPAGGSPGKTTPAAGQSDEATPTGQSDEVAPTVFPAGGTRSGGSGTGLIVGVCFLAFASMLALHGFRKRRRQDSFDENDNLFGL